MSGPAAVEDWPPFLHVVTDAGVLERDGWTDVAEEVLAAGGKRLALHVRGPELPGRKLHDLVAALVGPAERADAALVVNDRVDLALMLPVQAVQLGAGSLPVGEARRLLGDRVRIGASVRGPEAAREAEAQGADHLVVGTVFATRSHPSRPAGGPELLARVAREVRIPLVAIGGISPARVRAVQGAGARGVAALSGIWSSPDPARAVADYLGAHEADSSDPAAARRAGLANGGELPEDAVEVRINGKPRQIPAGLTVKGLIESLDLRPELIVVELNREILSRSRFAEVEVREGDAVELVHFVGGG